MLRTDSGTRDTWARGHRGALITAAAAVLSLGGALAACGGGDGRDAYLAPGGAAPDVSAAPARPTAGVALVPLDGPSGSATTPAAGGSSGPPAPPGATPAPGSGTAGTAAGSGREATGAASPADGSGGKPAPGGGSSAAGGSTPGGGTPPAGTAPGSAPPTGATPAALTWDPPVRADGEQRWCEDVTLVLRNSGGSAVRSGTVTFGTHVIGALGVDWATVGSTEDLPTPIGAGARVERTWTVCVDAWRVPWGMHVETRDVTVRWK
ncbi:hypothetical protein [Streptomyces sp. ACT015]|uniref:hypothetical protein n=1 Tax=Streptomyces sp. ACT015 TaxID=3134807 RepID=UPI003D16707F